jgi:hypothetical protein
MPVHVQGHDRRGMPQPLLDDLHALPGRDQRRGIEVTQLTDIATYFATRYGERIAHDVGIDPRQQVVHLEGCKASMGVTDDVEHLTYRELQARRETIRKRMEEHARTATKRGRRGRSFR